MEQVLDFLIFTMSSEKGTSSNSCKIKPFRTDLQVHVSDALKTLLCSFRHKLIYA